MTVTVWGKKRYDNGEMDTETCRRFVENEY